MAVEKPAEGQPPSEPKPGEEPKPKAGEEPKPKAGEEPKPEGGKEGEKPKAPATYEFQIPDDRKGQIPEKLLKRVESIARSNDWTNEEANAELSDLLKFEGELQAERLTAFDTETKANEKFGGTKLAETERLTNLAIQKVRAELGDELTDRFVGILKRSGYEKELSVVAVLATIGKLAAEDTPPRGRQAPKGSSGDGSDFYDHPSSKKAQEQGTAQ